MFRKTAPYTATMQGKSPYTVLVSLVFLFLLLVFTGTVVVESDVGQGFLDERSMTHLQTACVDFDREDSFNDDSCSKNEYLVEIFGDPTSTEGKYAEALSFDGIDDYLHSDIDYGSGNFTESIWIYSENASWGHSAVEWSGRWVTKHGTTHGGFFVRDETGGPLAGYRLVTTGDEKISFVPVEIETGKWIHITTVYEAEQKKLRLYKNGKFVDSTELKSHPQSWTGLRFGGQGAYWYNGSLDNYRKFNAALTSEQINALYNGDLTYYPVLYSEAIDIAYLFTCIILSLGGVYWRI